MKTDLVRHLTRAGYSPLRVQDRAVSAAAAKSLSVLGESSTRALLFHMCSITGMQEKELLSNYMEFERTLWSVLGNGADLLLKRFCDNLARNIDADGLDLTEVIDEIKRDEPYVFVRNMDYGENVLLLYRSTGFRDRIMTGFFDPLAGGAESRAALAADPPFPAHVSAMTYRQLQETYRGGTVGENVSRWSALLRQDGRHLRLARDNTWLAENKIDEEPHARPDTRSDAAVLCAYDAGRLSPENTVAIMESHDIVVFEESQAVHARR